MPLEPEILRKLLVGDTKLLSLTVTDELTPDEIDALSNALRTNFTCSQFIGRAKPGFVVYIERNHMISDLLKPLHDIFNIDNIDLDKINDNIVQLINLVPELSTEQSNLPENSYILEASRLMVALAYLSGGDYTGTIKRLNFPIHHPDLRSISEVIFSKALLLMPDENEQLENKYTLLAYTARNNPASAEFAVGIAGFLKKSSPDEEVHRVLSNPTILPNKAMWLVYDEIHQLAKQARDLSEKETPEGQILLKATEQLSYCPVTVDVLFKSPIFIHTLLESHPGQRAFQCLEGYLGLQYMKDLGGVYQLQVPDNHYIEGKLLGPDDNDLRSYQNAIANKSTIHSDVYSEVTALKQSILKHLISEGERDDVAEDKSVAYTSSSARIRAIHQHRDSQSPMKVSLANFQYTPDGVTENGGDYGVGMKRFHSIDVIVNKALNEKTLGTTISDLSAEHSNLADLLHHWTHYGSSTRERRAYDAARQAITNVKNRLYRVISMLEQGKSLEEAVWIFEIETVQRLSDDGTSYPWPYYKCIKDYLDNERELGNLLLYCDEGKKLLTVEEYLAALRNRYVKLSTRPADRKLRDYLAGTPGFSELFPDLIMPSNKASSSSLMADSKTGSLVVKQASTEAYERHQEENIIGEELSDCFDSSQDTNDNFKSLRVAINSFSEYVLEKNNQVDMDVAKKLNEKLSQLNSHGCYLTPQDKVTMHEMEQIIIDSYKALGPTADGMGYFHALLRNISRCLSYLSSFISGAQRDDIAQKSVEVGQINPTFFARSTRQKKAVEINEELNKCIEDHPKPGVS